MSHFSKASATEQHLRQILGMGGRKEDSTAFTMVANGSVETKNKMKIFCIDLTELPRVAQFLTLCGATFFFYLIYGYLQVRPEFFIS